MKIIRYFPPAVIILFSVSCASSQKSSLTLDKTQVSKDFLTLKEAVSALKVSEAAAPYNNVVVESTLPRSFRPPYRSIAPVKLFDNLYFVGTRTVGSYIIDSGEGLIMLDTGIGDEDASMMTEDMKKLGLDPASIKVIFISHEHFDHYGGVQYLKKNVCPGAKVALSLTGWNMLQNVPSEWAYIGKRPESVDIYLVDGMKIKVGNVIVQSYSTPGHSAGCMSFIFPVTENGEKHVVGIMGGSAVWPTQLETRLYKASVEYFSAIAKAEGCDIGLVFHPQEQDFAGMRNRKPGESNPLVIGPDEFNNVYLEGFRTRYKKMLESGSITPYQPI
ncbi:MAG TPA: MBL fold metallo-hydrolase [Bacteroidales bacterium]|nr:MBL fold metallo-hydrolase [Bacteroidales bacterium]